MRGDRAQVAARVRAVLGATPPATPPRPAARGRLAAAWQQLLLRRPVRVDPGRRGAIAVGVAAIVAALLTGAWVLRARPQDVPVRVAGPSLSNAANGSAIASGSTGTTSRGSFGAASSGGASSGGTSSGGTSSGGTSSGGIGVAAGSSGPGDAVVVDVAGKVRRPGLYRLRLGARVADALAAAGGVRPGVDTTPLNLAARVSDGQQIVVGVPGLSVSGSGGMVAGSVSSSNVGAAPSERVSLNSSTVEQLQTLPGVGPVLAQHIVDWRAAHGRFSSIDQLQDVSGIGPAKFAAMKDLVSL